MRDQGEASGIDRRLLLRLAAAAAGTWAGPAWATTTGAKTPGKIQAEEVTAITKEWSEPARAAAAEMLQKYGPPQEATASLLIWRDNGPWKRTIVHRAAIDHAFPAPHKDVLEQVVEYKVPLNFYNALAVYNGSVVAHRTRGELTAHGDREAENIVSLNLAQDIIRGRLTAEQAREVHAQTVRELLAGKTPEIAQKLLIPAPQGELADPDTPAVQPTGTSRP